MPKGALEEEQASRRPVILVRVGDEEMFEARHISAENRLVIPMIRRQVNLMAVVEPNRRPTSDILSTGCACPHARLAAAKYRRPSLRRRRTKDFDFQASYPSDLSYRLALRSLGEGGSYMVNSMVTIFFAGTSSVTEPSVSMTRSVPGSSFRFTVRAEVAFWTFTFA